jgi:putative transposase
MEKLLAPNKYKEIIITPYQFWQQDNHPILCGSPPLARVCNACFPTVAGNPLAFETKPQLCLSAHLFFRYFNPVSEKYKFTDPEGTYFITSSIVAWIDLFTRPELKHVVIDSLKHCQKEKGLVINAWCLMPSHLHLIARTTKAPLPDIMRDFKKFTAKEIIKVIHRINESRSAWMLDMFSQVADGLKRIDNYKVWQDGNHPELIFLPNSKSRN